MCFSGQWFTYLWIIQLFCAFLVKKYDFLHCLQDGKICHNNWCPYIGCYALMFTLYKSNGARSDTKMYSWIKKLDENDSLVVINYCSSKFCISYFVVVFMVNWFLSQQQHIICMYFKTGIISLYLFVNTCTCLLLLQSVHANKCFLSKAWFFKHYHEIEVFL